MTALSGGGTVTFGIDGTFNLTNTLVISTNVTLDGAGHAISISGSNAVRVFFVNPGINFTLNNLSVVNGSVTGTNGSNFTSGAGIYNNAGTVTSMNCVFSNNAVLGNNANQSSTTAAGGAIFNQTGTLSITNCTFITNSAIGGPHYGGYPGNGLGGAICSLGGSMSLNGDVFCANNSSGGSDAGVGPFAGEHWAAVWEEHYTVPTEWRHGGVGFKTTVLLITALLARLDCPRPPMKTVALPWGEPFASSAAR